MTLYIEKRISKFNYSLIFTKIFLR